MKKILYIADDEEPICSRCDYFGDDYEKYCISNCGPNYSWNRYVRTEEVDDEIFMAEILLNILKGENNYEQR